MIQWYDSENDIGDIETEHIDDVPNWSGDAHVQSHHFKK